MAVTGVAAAGALSHVDVLAYDESTLEALVTEQPTVPRVLGVDVGQTHLALWLGTPSGEHAARARSLADVHFDSLAWMLAHCGLSTRNSTAQQACDAVCATLRPYCARVFRFATHIVLELQHKRNPRMIAIARALRRFFAREVRPLCAANRAPVIVYREARHKFYTVAQLPCPMPGEYAQRKQAARNAVRAQLARDTDGRWREFYAQHASNGSADLSDARLIAQDYATCVCFEHLVVDDEAQQTVALEIYARRSICERRRTIGGGARPKTRANSGNGRHCKRRAKPAPGDDDAARECYGDAFDSDPLGTDIALPGDKRHRTQLADDATDDNDAANHVQQLRALLHTFDPYASGALLHADAAAESSLADADDAAPMDAGAVVDYYDQLDLSNSALVEHARAR
jgi:hypothetical protein